MQEVQCTRPRLFRSESADAWRRRLGVRLLCWLWPCATVEGTARQGTAYCLRKADTQKAGRWPLVSMTRIELRLNNCDDNADAPRACRARNMATRRDGARGVVGAAPLCVGRRYLRRKCKPSTCGAQFHSSSLFECIWNPLSKGLRQPSGVFNITSIRCIRRPATSPARGRQSARSLRRDDHGHRPLPWA